MTRLGYERIKVLILVKTYPSPSHRHEEIVCTAGVTEQGQWIRLYPIPFRRLAKPMQFRKYQWVELDVIPRGSHGDKRPESKTPDLDTMAVGEALSANHDWSERRRIVDNLPHRTVKECQQAWERDKTSLSVVVPEEIIDLKAVPVGEKELSKHQSDYEQIDMFGQQPLKLERLPYKFQYVFRCKDDDKPHNIMIEDWELGILFLKMRNEHQSEAIAIEKVREKFLGQICSPDRETRFFMGNHSIFPKTWLVVGVFWPPRISQLELFAE